MTFKQYLAIAAIVSLVTAPAGFFGAYYGAQMLAPASAQTAPLGNGGPSVGCPDATLTCTGGYNVQLNLGNANTWTATQTVSNLINNGLSANDTCVGTNGSKQMSDPATPCALLGSANTFTNFLNNTYVPTGPCQTGGPTAPLCVGSPTSAIALAIGHVTNPWGGAGSVDNSGQLQFYYTSATNVESHCGFFIGSANGAITETGTRACGMMLNGTMDMGLNSVSRVLKVGGGSAACSGTGTFTGQANSGGSQCLITLSSGSAVWTYATAWSNTPVCQGTDQTAANAVKVVPTTTTVTVTGTASDVIAVTCWGNGGT